MGRDAVRMCLICRRRAAKPSLVRLAAADGWIVTDPPARRPGRGAYLCPRPDCLEAALKRGGAVLVRALRRPTGQVRVDADALRTGWRHSQGSAPSATGAAAASRAPTPATAARPDRTTSAAARHSMLRLAPLGR